MGQVVALVTKQKMVHETSYYKLMPLFHTTLCTWKVQAAKDHHEKEWAIKLMKFQEPGSYQKKEPKQTTLDMKKDSPGGVGWVPACGCETHEMSFQFPFVRSLHHHLLRCALSTQSPPFCTGTESHEETKEAAGDGLFEKARIELGLGPQGTPKGEPGTDLEKKIRQEVGEKLRAEVEEKVRQELELKRKRQEMEQKIKAEMEQEKKNKEAEEQNKLDLGEADEVERKVRARRAADDERWKAMLAQAQADQKKRKEFEDAEKRAKKEVEETLRQEVRERLRKEAEEKIAAEKK